MPRPSGVSEYSNLGGQALAAVGAGQRVLVHAAAELIYYTAVDFAAVARGVDFVGDLVGGDHGSRSRQNRAHPGLIRRARE